MDFIRYLPEIFTGMNLLVLIGGTIGGLLLGATPGLSPTMAVALLIPFTFHMAPATSLILLGAVYTATVAGGAVSAVLVNIPGAPANIATVMDGHPMARSGRATEALHYCFISSLIGGVLGVFVLMFFTPVLARFAIQFGPAELFWMAILGVTVIGSLGSQSMIKGLIAGCVGLWLSTVGISAVLGVERFVFTDHLEGGINIIAALIGLFAIPQVLSLLERQSSGGAKMYQMEHHSVWTSFGETFRQVKSWVTGSVVGIIVGLVPGVGGQIAGLLAYDQAKKISKNKDEWGKGAPGGIVAAESANNAMVGPSLVPLLTLGLPGSPTAAVLLGGLLIHGLFPGPDLFTKHAATTWTFINSLLLGQILMAVFGLMISRYSRFVTRIPNNFMAAAVTILAVFGSYSVQNSMSDVFVMMTLGIAMYYGQKFGFSPSPLVLGIILGPIAEDNFAQGKMIAESGDGMASYFLTGTVNVLVISMCIASIGYCIYSAISANRKKRRNPTMEEHSHAA